MMDFIDDIILKYIIELKAVELFWYYRIHQSEMNEYERKIKELKDNIKFLKKSYITKVLNEFTEEIREIKHPKSIGRTSKIKEEIFLDFLSLRNRNKHLSITDAIKKISNKHDINESTMRKWLANNKKYLPNYESFKILPEFEILRIITEEEVRVLFINYDETKSKG